MGELERYLTGPEREALRETKVWLKQDASRLRKVLGMARKPLGAALKKLPEGVQESLTNAILTVLTSMRDGTLSLVSPGSVLQVLNERHGPIQSRADHFSIGVEHLDKVALGIVSQTRKACMAEGAVAGAAGLPGLVADIPALYALLFRMLSRLSIVYGFSTETEDERAHMLKILDLGHRWDPNERRLGMEEVHAIQIHLREQKPLDGITDLDVNKGLVTMARVLALSLTQRKLAQSIVLLGSLIGAGVNRGLAKDVGEVAMHAFRRRHLMELAAMRREGLLPNPNADPDNPAKKSRLPLPPTYS